MEDRAMQRQTSFFTVVLYYQKTAFFIGKVENICSDGIFVKTDSIELPDDNHLKIGFGYRANSRVEIYKLPVDIIHHKNDGLGLKFIDITNDHRVFAHTLLGYVGRENKRTRYQPELNFAIDLTGN